MFGPDSGAAAENESPGSCSDRLECVFPMTKSSSGASALVCRSSEEMRDVEGSSWLESTLLNLGVETVEVDDTEGWRAAPDLSPSVTELDPVAAPDDDGPACSDC